MQDDWIQVTFKEWLDTFLLIFMQNKQYRITSEHFIIFANFWKNLNPFMFKSFRSGIFESDPTVLRDFFGSGVMRNFWPINACQLFCFSE